ncbi:MAG: hypothetical protein QNJ17_08130 [Desulfocapsaceae bacterium]|nr:hypothetical protein [Desulfocapsaceae bacterium]
MNLIFFKSNHLREALSYGNALLFFSLPFLLVSCIAQQSYIGRTTMTRHVLSLSPDMTERVWQTNEIILNYQVNEQENGDALIISGNLSVKDSVTRTFPTVIKFNFFIHYLDENAQVISSHPIGINHGYKNKIAKDLKLLDVPVPPVDVVSFTFSYFGIMAGRNNEDGNLGEWQIYFNPFVAPNGHTQPTKDLFYQE